MAYKQGVALGASVTLMLGAVALLALYIACSSTSCRAIPYSYIAPIWTGVLTLGTGFVGIFMSATKSERGCGGFFLFLSIMGILATIGCTGITLFASLAELGLFYTSTYMYLPPSFNTNVTTTVAPPTAINPVAGFSLWMCMMGVAFILSIVTCVTSCQYCCCCQQREPQPVIVYQTGPNQPQNIVLENTNTILTPQVGPAVILANSGTPQGPQFVQHSYPTNQVFIQPPVPQQAVVSGYPPPYAAQLPTPFPSQIVPPGPPQQQLTQGSLQSQPSAPPFNPSPTFNRHPQQSAPPPRYHQQPQATNQSRPPVAGQSQPEHASDTRMSDRGPAPPVYQPLINDTRERSSEVQHTYNQTSRADQYDAGYTDTIPDSDSAIQHTYHLSRDRTPATDDGSYLEANQGANAPVQAPATTDRNSSVYEYIEEPSYDYADPQVAQETVTPTTNDNGEYVNDKIGRRGKAPLPKKSK